LDVTVIVANYNQLSTLPVVLASLDCQTQIPSRVIVADDGSCDGTIDWLDAIPGLFKFEISYVTHRHTGYGLTVIENLASSFVDSGRIMMTNADVIHGRNSVEAHAGMQPNQIAGGCVHEIAEPASRMVGVSDVRAGRIEEIFERNKGKVTNFQYFVRSPRANFYGIWGGNFSVSVEKFREVGGFNEDYHKLYGGEEADLIQRMRKMGGEPAWAYNSMAYHLAHPSRQYGKAALGNMKYRSEYLANNNHK
jgi:GT2 family glycosyltransferase